MPIPEAQLETWSHQGPTQQFTNTYRVIKNVLHDGSSPYAKRSFTTFLQGSYANDTNVYGDSDVDVVICTDNSYYSDLNELNEQERTLFEYARIAADYTWFDFKRDVHSWITSKYGAYVNSGSKAIFVGGSGARRNADVVVAAEFRRYRKFRGAWNENYAKGICFFMPNGTRVENFPKQHSDNCTAKHQATDGWFKPTVRIYKNLRNKLISDGIIRDDLAPSYFIEGMLYNVPNSEFGGTEQQNFADTLRWLNNADRSKFVCANELFYLFNPISPVTWRAEKCEAFLNAAVDLWNDW